MTAIRVTCPACGDRGDDPVSFGQPPGDGRAPLVACICDCGALFMVRLLDDGPDAVLITAAMVERLADQPAFADMMDAWARHKGLIP